MSTEVWRKTNRERMRASCRLYYEKHKDRQKEKYRKRNQELRLKCLIFYSGNPPECACCGEGHIEFLTIDHINNDGAEHRRQLGVGKSFYRWLIKENFPDGFRVLCYNCNCSLGHYGRCPHDSTSTRD